MRTQNHVEPVEGDLLMDSRGRFYRVARIVPTVATANVLYAVEETRRATRAGQLEAYTLHAKGDERMLRTNDCVVLRGADKTRAVAAINPVDVYRFMVAPFREEHRAEVRQRKTDMHERINRRKEEINGFYHG